MQYHTGLETVDFVPQLGIEEEMDEDLSQDLYIGIIDDFHDYRERMESLIQRHRNEAKKMESLLLNEKNEDVRMDYESLIKTMNRYADMNEEKLKIANDFKERLIFLVRQDGQPRFEMLPMESKKTYDAMRKEFLVYSYA